MISITKIFRFEAAHQLPYHQGACKNIHGHSYILSVEVAGPVQSGNHASAGMIMDFGELKKAVNHILEKLDHHLLNEIFTNPTAEIMVEWIAQKLQGQLFPLGIEPVKVRLHETSDSYAEWREG